MRASGGTAAAALDRVRCGDRLAEDLALVEGRAHQAPWAAPIDSHGRQTAAQSFVGFEEHQSIRPGAALPACAMSLLDEHFDRAADVSPIEVVQDRGLQGLKG